MSFRLLLTVITAELQVHDLNNNPLAVIPIGEAKIQQGFIRILHPINTSELGILIEDINRQINHENHCTPIHQLLIVKQQILYDTYMKLSPIVNTHTQTHTRTKRWDTVGTVFKWIAGTPDAEDLRLINSSMNSLITETNKQILVNQQLNERITTLANITNTVLALYNSSLQDHYQETHQLIMLNNIESLINHLETIEDAILLAKHGIPSSKILSIHDFNKMATFLQDFDIPIDSMEQILSISSAQVTLNKTHIIYIIKVPRRSKEVYTYDYVDSIISGKKRILVTKNYYLRNSSDVYELNEPCLPQEDYYLCPEQSINIAPRCIEKLIKGLNSNCTYEKVYSGSLIKRITENSILINNGRVELTSSCRNETQKLNGSYLILFNDCDLQINGETFTNYQTTIKPRIYQPTTGLTVDEYKFIDAPPADVLKELTLEHRDRIDTLQLQNSSLHWKTHLFGTLSIGMLFTITIAYFAMKLIIKKRRKISITLNQDIPLQEQPITSAPPDDSNSITQQGAYSPQTELNKYLSTPAQFRTIHFADKVI